MARLTLSALTASLLLATTAHAVETGCTAPTTPTLPASITSQSQAESLEAGTVSYLESVSSYQQCLVDWANDNESSLTEADRTELRSLYDAQTNASKTYSEEWNTKLLGFLNSQ